MKHNCRWLKQKNQSKRAESREKDKKRQEDKEEMKTVLNNIKTRFEEDYTLYLTHTISVKLEPGDTGSNTGAGIIHHLLRIF